MVAAYYGKTGCVRILAQKEAKMVDEYKYTALMYAAYRGHLECVKVLALLEKEMKNKWESTALMSAAENGHLECVMILAPEEAGMRDNDGQTAMMRSTKKCEIASFLSPFEAGLADNNGWNQTCYAIDNHRNIIAAIRLEKTAGWLSRGKTILEAKIYWKSLSEEDKERIQQNPLWEREIGLAETQQKRYEARL